MPDFTSAFEAKRTWTDRRSDPIATPTLNRPSQCSRMERTIRAFSYYVYSKSLAPSGPEAQ